VNLAQAAKAKLAEKNWDVGKMTKKEIRSLLFVFYGTSMDDNKNQKPAMVAMLSGKIQQSPQTIGAVSSALDDSSSNT